MFGIGWNEFTMIVGGFTIIMVWVMILIAFIRKGHDRPAASSLPHAPAWPLSPPRPEPPPLRFSDAARLHFFLVFVVFFLLMLSAPLAWILLGQEGIPFVKAAVVGVLLVAFYAVLAIGISIITRKSPATHSATPNGFMQRQEPSTHAELVARITLRFCPQCRAPLAPDAPEGLCPACLMAGGLASAAAIDPANGMAMTTPPSGSKPPAAGEWTDLAQHFPQLEILELLGRGGMGAVYKARQKNLDRMIALKVIPPEAARDPTFAERFAREARALARLNHPNIVTVYDFGQIGDVYYLLMEYVDGVNLRHAQHERRLAPQEALAIVPQICDALQYAHDQGVVHRDIKPENVLLDRSGRVKIADFGLAKMLGKGPDDFTLTRTQQVMGTPRYMAPEQIEKPTTVDHRADIYSVGVVLYEMLTGELPIGRFQPPSQKVQLDVRIDQVVLRALEKEPDRRYQRASQVKTELASATPPTWHTPAPAVKRTVSPNHELILRRVRGPAAGLQAAGVLGLFPIALAIVAAIYFARQARSGAISGVGVIELLMLLILVPLSCVILLGGLQMWQLRNYNLARVAAVLSMLPCGPGWIVGLPMGLWALVVLLDPEVRAAFEGSQGAIPPRKSHDPPQPRGSGLAFGAGFGIAGIAMFVIMIPCVAVLIALLLPAVQAAREAARRSQSSNNLKQLGIALHNYHDVYGTFPPAVVRDADGKPLYSGRVLLLPFLEQQNLYNSLDLSQSWDSPRNQPYTDMPLPVFMDPSDHVSQLVPKTNYRFVTGAGTMFEADKSVRLMDIRDGASNTIAIVEVHGEGITWAQPDDIDFTRPKGLPTGSHPGGNLVLFADGSVQLLSKTMTGAQVRDLATIAGGEMSGRLPNIPVRPQPPQMPQPPLQPEAAPQPAAPRPISPPPPVEPPEQF